MISVVICSRQRNVDEKLKTNIGLTIGLPYEIVHIDNQQNDFSIFSAYNSGAARAKYGILCFIHEDIKFLSSDWGKSLTNLLEDKNTGVIGVAGSSVKSEIPSPWWVTNHYTLSNFSYNILQHLSTGVKEMIKLEKPLPNNCSEVVVTDGMFMCCRKEVWKENTFDEKRYNGFHFYDIDFSMSVYKKGYKNYVTGDILVEHFSSGKWDKPWIDAALVFHEKWKKNLPVYIHDISNAEKKRIKIAALKSWLVTLMENNCGNTVAWWKDYMKYFFIAPASKEPYRLFYQKFSRK